MKFLDLTAGVSIAQQRRVHSVRADEVDEDVNAHAFRPLRQPSANSRPISPSSKGRFERDRLSRARMTSSMAGKI